MPLPQQVVEQLGREPEGSGGGFSGTLLFSVGILLVIAGMYFGMVFGYEPYLNNQIIAVKGEVSKANASVTPDEQAQLVSFYSQISNLQTILTHHAYDSQFLTWLENNTEANVYYQGMDLASGYRVTLKGIAKTEADVNQQVAVFEGSPDVASVAVASVANASQNGISASTGIAFTLSLIMNPSIFLSKTP